MRDLDKKYLFNTGNLVVLVFLLTIFFTASFLSNHLQYSQQQFIFLAQSFLKGKLYFLEMPGSWIDVALQGNYYWPLGPFPAVLLAPFVYISDKLNLVFYQGNLQFPITVGIFLFCFRLAKKHGFSKVDSLYLAFAFCFASVYQQIAIIPSSWFFSQAVVVFLLFWSLQEYFGKRRYLLIGIMYGLVFATRFSAGLGVLFFAISALFDQGHLIKNKLQNIAKLAIPIALSGILLLSYNQARFGDMFDNGYLRATPELGGSVKVQHGLFDLNNIPTNFYYFFVKSFEPIVEEDSGGHYLKFPFVKANPFGMSFFLVAPVFLYTLKADLKKGTNRMLLVPVVLILSILLVYYWSGWRQVGPRYFLDFLPFVYVLLLSSFNNFRLTFSVKAIIVLSSLVNVYLLNTIF